MSANAASGSIIVRKSADRGTSELGWLHSRFSFSFADYYDPAHMGFRALRVINDDVVEPGRGFGMHPHQDMEIVSYVVSGALEHKDSMGNGSIIRPGDVQRMTAGTGVLHSEFNPSKTEPVHLLQIWLLPERKGLEPGYEERRFDPAARQDRLCLIGSRDGQGGSVTIHQDVRLYATLLTPGAQVSQPLDPARHVWMQVVGGRLLANGSELQTGDGAAITGTSRLDIHAREASELLVFDLA